jgi:hypothetical protein
MKRNIVSTITRSAILITISLLFLDLILMLHKSLPAIYFEIFISCLIFYIIVDFRLKRFLVDNYGRTTLIKFYDLISIAILFFLEYLFATYVYPGIGK